MFLYYIIIPCFARLLVQIHDELLFEVPDEEVASVSGKVKEVLEQVKSLPCKLKASYTHGTVYPSNSWEATEM